MKFLRRTLEIQENCLGKEKLSLQQNLINLAIEIIEFGDLNKAKDIEENCLRKDDYSAV